MAYVPLSPMARAVGRIIADHGEAMTLKRSTEGTTISLKGKRLTMREAEEGLGNTSTQTRFRAKIGTAEILASAWAVKAPKRADSMIVDGRERSVLGVWPIKDATGALTVYELELAG